MKSTTKRSSYIGTLYGITITQSHYRWPSPIDYEEIIEKLERKGFNFLDYKYEVGKFKRKNVQTGKLHVHGIVEYNKVEMPYFKSFLPYGTDIKLEKIYNMKGWTKYTNKDDDSNKIQKYLLSHFYDMETQDFDFENPLRYNKPIKV